MLTRRAFVLSSTAATLRAAAKVPVGAHCWIFAAKQPGYDVTPILDQVFKEFAAAGIDGIELMQHPLLAPGGPQRVKELSAKYRLPFWGTSWSAPMWDASKRDAVLAEGTTLIKNIAAAGGSELGLSVGDAKRRKTPEELDAQAAVLRSVFAISRDHGVTANLHNHVYEVADGEYDLRNTLERIPDARLGPDVGWLFRAKIDPVDFIRRHGRRMVYVHLRNEKADGKWPETLEEGVIDFTAVGKALRETGFAGKLAIELAHESSFTPTQSFGESLRKSRLYAKRVLGY